VVDYHEQRWPIFGKPVCSRIAVVTGRPPAGREFVRLAAKVLWCTIGGWLIRRGEVVICMDEKRTSKPCAAWLPQRMGARAIERRDFEYEPERGSCTSW